MYSQQYQRGLEKSFKKHPSDEPKEQRKYFKKSVATLKFPVKS